MITALAGPEIVLVDADTYNLNGHDIMDLDIHACWYEDTQLTGENPYIEVFWKGHYIKHTINASSSLSYNNKCCDNKLITLHIDFANNTLMEIEILENKLYYPVYTVVGTTYNFGYTTDSNQAMFDNIQFNSVDEVSDYIKRNYQTMIGTDVDIHTLSFIDIVETYEENGITYLYSYFKN